MPCRRSLLRGDHRKEQRTSLPLTSAVVASFAGPTLPRQAIGIQTWLTCALLALRRAAHTAVHGPVGEGCDRGWA